MTSRPELDHEYLRAMAHEDAPPEPGTTRGYPTLRKGVVTSANPLRVSTNGSSDGEPARNISGGALPLGRVVWLLVDAGRRLVVGRADEQQQATGSFVEKAGDTMTGPLTVPGLSVSGQATIGQATIGQTTLASGTYNDHLRIERGTREMELTIWASTPTRGRWIVQGELLLNIGTDYFEVLSDQLRHSGITLALGSIDLPGWVRCGFTGGTPPGNTSTNGSGLIGDSIRAGRDGFASLYLSRQGSNGQLTQWNREGNTVGSISVTTTSTSYNTSSDYRLKTDVEDADPDEALAALMALRPVSFRWIAEPDQDREVGFIAHELAEVLPNAVVGEKDALDDEGNIDPQGVDPSKVVALIVAVLRHAFTEIGDIRDRLEPPAWVQPTGAHDAYPAGAIVTHNGQTWVNTHGDGNVWEPGVFGWTPTP